MKKQNRSVKNVLAVVFASVLMSSIFPSGRDDVAGQQEKAAYYSCNGHYAIETPFDDKDGNN